MLLLILSSILLSLVGYSDVKTRSFHVAYWVVYVLLGVMYFCTSQSLDSTELLANLSFFALVISSVWGYFFLRRGVRLSFFKEYLGLGDVLLFLTTCFFFDANNYIFFFLVSVFSAAIVYAIKYVINRSVETIPLAFFIALSFSATWISDRIIDY